MLKDNQTLHHRQRYTIQVAQSNHYSHHWRTWLSFWHWMRVMSYDLHNLLKTVRSAAVTADTTATSRVTTVVSPRGWSWGLYYSIFICLDKSLKTIIFLIIAMLMKPKFTSQPSHLMTMVPLNLWQCIDQINSWMSQNDLQLNKDRTVILFGKKLRET